MSDTSLTARQKSQEAHFIRRAQERFDLNLSLTAYGRLCRRVTDDHPGTKFIAHQPPTRTVWCIRIGGLRMRVIFDHETDRLVTCLPYGDSARGDERSDSNKQFKRRRLARIGRKPWKSSSKIT